MNVKTNNGVLIGKTFPEFLSKKRYPDFLLVERNTEILIEKSCFLNA